MALLSMRLDYSAGAPLTPLGGGTAGAHGWRGGGRGGARGWASANPSPPVVAFTAPLSHPCSPDTTLRGARWTHWGLWWVRGEWPDSRTQKSHTAASSRAEWSCVKRNR